MGNHWVTEEYHFIFCLVAVVTQETNRLLIQIPEGETGVVLYKFTE